ncbi:hypothetical protein Vadar_018180 [Vaccinium darrowii]|uniref:Uncharacterized protein n=1 Tax=Vaccinium darrowii TaxID=229202 RepID=A0ACB7Y0B3_9ERIC|nr:hypothetical protein Vadar_018180 [Vaccinium darrowii]
MGDTSVDFFLETLKQLITSSKLDSIIDEKHKLQSLEDEVKYLRGFLKVTEKKRNEHSEVMKLVMEIRDVVSEAENIVEGFVIRSIKTLFSSTEEIKKIPLELESVKKEITILMTTVKQNYNENIYDINGVAVKKFKHSSARSTGGGLDSSGGSNTSKVVKEKLVVGFDDEVKTLLEKLDDIGEGRPLEIVTIIGAAGSGKTTLAEEVFDHPLTSHIFEIRAWVDVSQDYDKTKKKDLLIRVLKSAIPKNHEDRENSEDIWGEKVLKCLKGRKYLIVMDDIWGVEAWNDIQRVLSFVSTACQGEIGIGHLVHLRYLALRVPRQRRFLSSPFISNLLNLETLDLHVRYPFDVIQLPCDIFKMVKLRHLYSKNGVFEYHFSSEEASRIGFDHSSNLDTLQTLHRICACQDCQNFLTRTPNLRKLGLVKNLELRDGGFVVPNLDFLKCLETLRFDYITLTTGLKLPLTVKRLTLFMTQLKWEELSIIQNLPSLEVLKFVYDTGQGPVWNISEEGFSQLKYLSLSLMNEMEEWNASEDQFPRLEVLVLKSCRKLKRIPIDFANLNELREIKLVECTRSVEESARKIQEQQRDKKGDDCLNLIVKSNFFE